MDQLNREIELANAEARRLARARARRSQRWAIVAGAGTVLGLGLLVALILVLGPVLFCISAFIAACIGGILWSCEWRRKV